MGGEGRHGAGRGLSEKFLGCSRDGLVGDARYSSLPYCADSAEGSEIFAVLEIWKGGVTDSLWC